MKKKSRIPQEEFKSIIQAETVQGMLAMVVKQHLDNLMKPNSGGSVLLFVPDVATTAQQGFTSGVLTAMGEEKAIEMVSILRSLARMNVSILEDIAKAGHTMPPEFNAILEASKLAAYGITQFLKQREENAT